MADSYKVLRWGDRHLVEHIPSSSVIAECPDKYTAAGIVNIGNKEESEQGSVQETADPNRILPEKWLIYIGAEGLMCGGCQMVMVSPGDLIANGFRWILLTSWKLSPNIFQRV